MVKNKSITILDSFSYYSENGRRTVNIYSMKDVIFSEIPQIKQLEIPEINDRNLEEAIYLINKSAKVSRDTKQKSYWWGLHRPVKASKTRSKNLYDLKDEALTKMLAENRIKYVGIHKQTVDEKTTYLQFYRGNYFSFHSPAFSYSESEIIGEIDELISSEKTQKTSLTFPQAVKLLEKYIGS